MLELSLILNQIQESRQRLGALRGYLDYDRKRARLSEVVQALEDPALWENLDRVQALGKERAALGREVAAIDGLDRGLAEATELLELAAAEDDAAAAQGVAEDVSAIDERLGALEFQRMFSGEMDANPAFLDVQAGAGGTEAQDWAEMLLRMYLKWGDRRGYKCELIEVSPGEVAGIKSATVYFQGDYAFGWLRTETGVHRLVRKSPFDSGNRRHTSFASVFVSPEIDDSVDIVINPADLRVDTYRASGAGGQHVNKTDSAIRITHLPTGSVVQCQNERSQHKNRAQAMKMLRAKLYETEMKKRDAEKQALEESKAEIGWGSQIRSYVLDQSRIKDLRTGVESGNPQAVLDGDLDRFIEASLKLGV
ncbi:MAG: peptide chain release factor 2 [Chromatiales bacterium]